jgi:MFS family permease
MNSRKHKLFYGWWILGAGFFIIFYIAGFIQFGFTAFFEPIANDFGWSYAQVSLAGSLRGLEMGLFAPVVGFLVDRWGPRRLMFTGAAIVGLGLLLLSRINSLVTFYGAFMLIAAGISTCVGVVPITTVNYWFRRRATTATGILVSGTAIGGLLVPLATLLIDTYDWRSVMVILGFGAWGILLPLSLLFRHKPEQYGYLPDGDSAVTPPPTQDQPPAQDAELNIGVKQALKSRTFWHIAIGLTCHIMVMNAVVIHVMPYLSSTGIARSISSLVASAIPLASILGRLSFGWLGDRYDKKRITALGFALAIFGLILFGYLATAGTWVIVPFIILIGIGYGGPVPMMPALLREYFGRVKLGTLLGLVMGVASAGAMIGPPLAGWVFDKFGSYQGAWFAFAGLLVAGMFILLTTPPVNRKMYM